MIRLVMPMSEISHDVKLPADLTVKDAVSTLLPMLKGLHSEDLLLTPNHMLCRSATGEPLSRLDETLENCGVRDADILYLV